MDDVSVPMWLRGHNHTFITIGTPAALVSVQKFSRTPLSEALGVARRWLYEPFYIGRRPSLLVSKHWNGAIWSRRQGRFITRLIGANSARGSRIMPQRPELLIGFVGPAGVDLTNLCDKTASYLKEFGYSPVEIRLSKLLKLFKGWTSPLKTSEDERILHLQQIGHNFRVALNSASAIALASLVAIREERRKLSGDPNIPGNATAYLLNQLKHPDEVRLLRRIYGPSFVLIAAHAPLEIRRDRLALRIATSEERSKTDEDVSKAQNIMRIDDEEPSDFMGADKLGQNTRNTYPLADMFVDLQSDDVGCAQARRFIDLLFGHPFHSPRPEEVAMHHARAAALRSSDESRQVGAVIVNVKRDNAGKVSNVEMVATGMNEVPMRGGGFYWDGSASSPDARDQWLIGYGDGDRALTIKKDVLRELIEFFQKNKWFKDSIQLKQTPDILRELIPDGLKGSQYLNIGEFQREVHAEMAALIDSARRGVAVDGLTMYVTTFPCHNCAKHIIAAGIREVIYLEPYPKSRAETLHKEEINTDPIEDAYRDGDKESGSPPKVIFMPYTGVAPRQYQRLFGMSARGKKVLFGLKEWGQKKTILSPVQLIDNAFASYTISEQDALKNLPVDKYAWDPKSVCPAG